jgi:hypothetical protein
VKNSLRKTGNFIGSIKPEQGIEPVIDAEALSLSGIGMSLSGIGLPLSGIGPRLSGI